MNWVQQAISEGKHPFFIQIPITKNYHRQDTTTVVGLGSKVERSRTGHKMSQKFIDRMKQTALGKPLLLNHDPNQVAGNVVQVAESAKDEFMPVSELYPPHENPIVDAPRAKVEQMIENGTQLGYSIGGIASESKVVQDGNRYGVDVEDGELIEMSITPINALKSSDGTVKIQNSICKDGICGQIAQQILYGPIDPVAQIKESADLIKQSSGYILNKPAYDNVIAQIEAGNIDFDTPWNRGTYEWSSSNNSPDPQNWCLGVDPTAPGTGYSGGNYKYRAGLEGKVFKSAIIAGLADVQTGTDIYEALDEILEQIYSVEDTTETSAQETEENDELGQGLNGNEPGIITGGAVVEGIKANQSMERINMDEKEQKEFNELKQSVADQKKIIEGFQKDKEEKDKLEQATLAKAAKEKEQKELVEATTGAMAEFMKETILPLMTSGRGVRQQSLGGPNNPGPEPQNIVPGLVNPGAQATIPGQVKQVGAELTKEELNLRDSVHYPGVVNGKAVQGLTPAQMFGLN